MFGIYHYFSHMLNMRPILPKTADLTRLYRIGHGAVYRRHSGFPTFVLRSNLGEDPLGGEIVALLEDCTGDVPPFEAHLPRGDMTLSSLGHEKAGKISRSIRRSDDDARPHESREVYYFIRSRLPYYSKICLVHGSFFASVTSEQLVRETLRQVIDENLEAPGTVADDTVNTLASLLEQECFSDRLRSVYNASVEFRLRICAEVHKKANIMNSYYFPEIAHNTMNFVIPYLSTEDLVRRKRYLRQALSRIEVEQGTEAIISHPFNGDFFVLSYSL